MPGGELVIGAPDPTEFRELQGFYSEEWGEVNFLRALEKKLRAGDVCYDVGSNVGQFLIPVAKILGGRGLVIGFEPHPGNHLRLIRTVAFNWLTNVMVFRLALSDYSGETPIFGADSGATIVAHGATEGESLPAAIVPVARGDDVRKAAGLPLPRAVKIDVEGAEFGVLSGLKDTLASPACELLCLEIHPHLAPPQVTAGMLLSLLRSLGFNCTQTRPRPEVIHVIAEKAPASRPCDFA
jgi:FkbM family methyltransferase